jgi:hypothetical protein
MFCWLANVRITVSKMGGFPREIEHMIPSEDPSIVVRKRLLQ